MGCLKLFLAFSDVFLLHPSTQVCVLPVVGPLSTSQPAVTQQKGLLPDAVLFKSNTPYFWKRKRRKKGREKKGEGRARQNGQLERR